MPAFFGESAHYIELNSSIANAMRTFPKKYKHLNIVLHPFQSRIRNGKRAFSKIWKIRRAIFQIFGNSKIGSHFK